MAFVLSTSAVSAEELDFCERHLAPSQQELTGDQKALFKEFDTFIQSEKASVRLVEAASRIRLQKDGSGRVLFNRPVTILVHGLFNSPAWFQEMENLAFASGSHVLNIRLPGHYTVDPESLDRVKYDEWMHVTRQSIRWAQVLNSKITYIGHSTGALAGVIANAEQPGVIKKMILFSPAFQVSQATRMQIKTFTSLGLSGWLLGQPKGEERYLSTWAGAQVEELTQVAASFHRQSDYVGLMPALSQVNIMWIDTRDDRTLDISRNLDLAHHISEKSKSFRYILLDSALNVPHNANGSFTLDSSRSLLQTLFQFLESR